MAEDATPIQPQLQRPAPPPPVPNRGTPIGIIVCFLLTGLPFTTYVMYTLLNCEKGVPVLVPDPSQYGNASVVKFQCGDKKRDDINCCSTDMLIIFVVVGFLLSCICCCGACYAMVQICHIKFLWRLYMRSYPDYDPTPPAAYEKEEPPEISIV